MHVYLTNQLLFNLLLSRKFTYTGLYLGPAPDAGIPQIRAVGNLAYKSGGTNTAAALRMVITQVLVYMSDEG